MFVDTHTHVQFKGFYNQTSEVMQRALDAGVVVINVGTQKGTSREAVEMLSVYPKNVYAVIGLHPLHAFSQHVDEEESSFQTREEVFDYKYYKGLAGNPGVVGIGECGLDYFRLPEGEDHGRIKQLQIMAFRSQVKLALELDKVLCVHCRPSHGTMDAYEELYEILKDEKSLHPNLKFEVHCYTGDLRHAQKFVSLGGFIGVNGIVTFDRTGVAAEVVKNIPLENILLETDAPYLTPVPLRGNRNEPLYIKYVAEKVAEIKQVGLQEVSLVTTNNATQLFKL